MYRLERALHTDVREDRERIRGHLARLLVKPDSHQRAAPAKHDVAGIQIARVRAKLDDLSRVARGTRDEPDGSAHARREQEVRLRNHRGKVETKHRPILGSGARDLLRGAPAGGELHHPGTFLRAVVDVTVG